MEKIRSCHLRRIDSRWENITHYSRFTKSYTLHNPQHLTKGQAKATADHDVYVYFCVWACMIAASLSSCAYSPPLATALVELAAELHYWTTEKMNNGVEYEESYFLVNLFNCRLHIWWYRTDTMTSGYAVGGIYGRSGSVMVSIMHLLII